METREHNEFGQVKRVTVTRGATGWDLREEINSTVVRTATYTDWHRVERALQVFDLQDSGDTHSTNR